MDEHVFAKSTDSLESLFVERAAEVLRRVAESAIPETWLECLATHPNADIRIAVSENPGTAIETLRLLAIDPDPDVRFAVAENHNISMTILSATPLSTIRQEQQSSYPSRLRQDSILVEIQDNGQGFQEPDTASTQGGPITTGDIRPAARESERPGLGLSIVKELLSDIGGSVTIRSDARYGTIVTVQLIASEAAPMKHPPDIRAGEHEITRLAPSADQDREVPSASAHLPVGTRSLEPTRKPRISQFSFVDRQAAVRTPSEPGSNRAGHNASPGATSHPATETAEPAVVTNVLQSAIIAQNTADSDTRCSKESDEASNCNRG